MVIATTGSSSQVFAAKWPRGWEVASPKVEETETRSDTAPEVFLPRRDYHNVHEGPQMRQRGPGQVKNQIWTASFRMQSMEAFFGKEKALPIVSCESKSTILLYQ